MIDDVLPSWCATPVELILRQSPDFAGPICVLAVQLSDGVVLWEPDGYQGAHARVLEAVSLFDRAASAFWNVNAVTRLSLAEGGSLVASGEAVNPPFATEGCNPVILAELMNSVAPQLELGDVSTMVAIVSAYTGLDVTPSTFDRVDAGFLVSPLLEVPKAAPSPMTPSDLVDLLRDRNFGLGDDTIARSIASLSDAAQDELAIWSVDNALRSTGLSDVPELALAFARYRDGIFQVFGNRETNTVRRLIAHQIQAQYSHDPLRRRSAGAALRTRAAAESLYELCAYTDQRRRLVSSIRRAMVADAEGRAAWIQRCLSYIAARQ